MSLFRVDRPTLVWGIIAASATVLVWFTWTVIEQVSSQTGTSSSSIVATPPSGTPRPAEKKHDIRGFETGMTHGDVSKKLESMHCSTNELRSREKSWNDFGLGLAAGCGSDRFVFQFSPHLENQPVIEVGIVNRTPRSLQDVIRSVEAQYQVSLKAPNLSEFELAFYRVYKAELGAGLGIAVLKNNPNYSRSPADQPGDESLLLISDTKLIEKTKAVAAKIEDDKKREFRSKNPLPKY